MLHSIPQYSIYCKRKGDNKEYQAGNVDKRQMKKMMMVDANNDY